MIKIQRSHLHKNFVLFLVKVSICSAKLITISGVI